MEDCLYYDILLCLTYHSNFIIFCTADDWVQPKIAASTAIHWFWPLVVGCQIRFIVDIGIREKLELQSKIIMLIRRDHWDPSGPCRGLLGSIGACRGPSSSVWGHGRSVGFHQGSGAQ